MEETKKTTEEAKETEKTEEQEVLDDPLAKEISDMLDGLEQSAETPEEDDETSDGDEEASAEETPATEDEKPPEGEEPPSGESVEEPPTEAPSEWEKERQELLERIDRLTNMVEQLSEVKLKAGKPQAEKPAEEVPPPKPAAGEEEQMDFLQGDTIDVLIDEDGKFNQVLNRVYQTAVQQAEAKVFEKVLTSIPDIIVGHLNRQTSIQAMVKEFYDQNPDLAGVKRTVAAVSNDVHAEHPDWDVKQVLEESAKRTRELLGIKKSAEKREESSPAFAKVGGTKTPRKRTRGLQDEIDELLNM